MKFFSTILLLLKISLLCGQSVQLLKDINEGENSSMFNEDNISIKYNDIVLFAANDGIHGVELWKFDGEETTLVKDINEGENDSECHNFYIINDQLLFTADDGIHGQEWWVTDGTEEGTNLLVDIFTGISDGVYSFNWNSNWGFHVYNDEILFVGIDAANNWELWKTNGTAEGTQLLKNITSDFSSFNRPSFPEQFVDYNDEVYFSCREGLWKTNGTEEGTVEILNEDPDDPFGFEPDHLFSSGDYLLMLQGQNLWTSDGTTNGTIKIKDLVHTNINWTGNKFAKVGDYVLFPGDDDVNGDELWRTDGTTDGTQMVKDLWPGSGGYAPQNGVVLNNKLYYKGNDGQTGIELYSSDGTEANTQLVTEIKPGSSGAFSLPTTIITDGELIYMNAATGFYSELWISNGTAAGTYEFIINPAEASRPTRMYLVEDKLFLFAYSSELGYEPYIIDIHAEVIDMDMDGFAVEDDCDDTNDAINPDAEEVPYDGVDNDCNPATLDDDLDQDGFVFADDCDDTNFDINPNVDEIPYDGIDNDCNPATLDDDLDQDGFVLTDDCDDTNFDINPNAEEIANNGIDEDCDGEDLVVGLYELTGVSLKIFPNPTSDYINIQVEGYLDYNIRLFDLNGKHLLSTRNANSIDISSLGSGVYLLEITDLESNEQLIEKIIVEAF